MLNEIRGETREVASTVADTRTRQKIKRKDLPTSSKEEIKFSIMSSTLDEKNLHLLWKGIHMLEG